MNRDRCGWVGDQVELRESVAPGYWLRSSSTPWGKVEALLEPEKKICSGQGEGTTKATVGSTSSSVMAWKRAAACSLSAVPGLCWPPLSSHGANLTSGRGSTPVTGFRAVRDRYGASLLLQGRRAGSSLIPSELAQPVSTSSVIRHK